MLRPVVLGAALAALGTLHAAVNARLLRRPVDDTGVVPSTSVLIPARDEAAILGACLESLRDQRGVVEVLVFDDGSRDDTAAVAVRHGARVLRGPGPGTGELGKPMACRRLAAEAVGEVLVLVDADVRLAPGAVAAAVGLLQSTGLDLVSPHPRQDCGSVAERLVQPLLQWSVLTALPLRLAERSTRPSLAAANGQFLVVRRAAYRRAGGHPRAAVVDDIALLRAVLRSGGHGAVVDGTDLARCRMYDGWPALRDGYGRWLWSAFGGLPGSAAVVGTVLLAYVLPPVAMVRGSRVGAAGYAVAILGRVVVARRTGGRSADALAHPVSVVIFTYLLLRSHVQHARGRLEWKGRRLP